MKHQPWIDHRLNRTNETKNSAMPGWQRVFRWFIIMIHDHRWPKRITYMCINMVIVALAHSQSWSKRILKSYWLHIALIDKCCFIACSFSFSFGTVLLGHICVCLRSKRYEQTDERTDGNGQGKKWNGGLTFFHLFIFSSWRINISPNEACFLDESLVLQRI